MISHEANHEVLGADLDLCVERVGVATARPRRRPLPDGCLIGDGGRLESSRYPSDRSACWRSRDAPSWHPRTELAAKYEDRERARWLAAEFEWWSSREPRRDRRNRRRKSKSNAGQRSAFGTHPLYSSAVAKSRTGRLGLLDPGHAAGTGDVDILSVAATSQIRPMHAASSSTFVDHTFKKALWRRSNRPHHRCIQSTAFRCQA